MKTAEKETAENRRLSRGRRASKSKKNGDWVIGYYTGEDNGVHYIKVGTQYYAVHGDTIGDCTGLHANRSYRGESETDRLIFEGDIGRTSKNGNIVTVAWDSEHLCWCGISKEYPGTYKINRNFEILGTIYTKNKN